MYFYGDAQQKEQKKRQIVNALGTTALIGGTLAAGYALGKNPGVKQAVGDVSNRVSSFLGRFTQPDLNGPSPGQKLNQEVVRNITQRVPDPWTTSTVSSTPLMDRIDNLVSTVQSTPYPTPLLPGAKPKQYATPVIQVPDKNLKQTKRIYAGIGSRQTPPDVLNVMTQLASKLEQNDWMLRSGGAPGADSAFEAGVQNPGNRSIYLPKPGFQQKYPRKGSGYFDARTLPGWEQALQTVDIYHPAPDRLSDYARVLMARNAMQVLGPNLDSPADMIVAWTPGGELKGGTAQALRMAMDNNIKIRNLGNPKVLRSVKEYLNAT